jgi:hypothetical protein
MRLLHAGAHDGGRHRHVRRKRRAAGSLPRKIAWSPDGDEEDSDSLRQISSARRLAGPSERAPCYIAGHVPVAAFTDVTSNSRSFRSLARDVDARRWWAGSRSAGRFSAGTGFRRLERTGDFDALADELFDPSFVRSGQSVTVKFGDQLPPVNAPISSPSDDSSTL